MCGTLHKDGVRQHYALCAERPLNASAQILCNGKTLVAHVEVPGVESCLKCGGEDYVVEIYKENGLAKLRRKAPCIGTRIGGAESLAAKLCPGGKIGEEVLLSF